MNTHKGGIHVCYRLIQRTCNGGRMFGASRKEDLTVRAPEPNGSPDKAMCTRTRVANVFFDSSPKPVRITTCLDKVMGREVPGLR